MKKVLTQNKKHFIDSIITATATVVFSFLFISTFSLVVDAAVPIPIGCPGATQAGPPTAAQKAVCDAIPPGCPGATRAGPADSKVTCPYGTDAAVTTSDSVPECSAQTLNSEAKCEITADCKDPSGNLTEDNCDIIKYLKTFINILAGAVGVTVVAVLVFGGIQYSTSAGNPQAAAAAKKRIANAILALVAFALMYGFLQWVVPGGVL